jgi:hypothetical protein
MISTLSNKEVLGKVLFCLMETILKDADDKVNLSDGLYYDTGITFSYDSDKEQFVLANHFLMRSKVYQNETNSQAKDDGKQNNIQDTKN